MMYVRRITVFTISFLILFGLVFASPSIAKVDLEKHLVGLWKFDEGKGGKTKDDSGKGLEAELEGKCKWVKGKFGNAIEFDGKSAYVKTKPHANPTKAITVSAWVKSASKSWNAHGVIMSKRNAYIIHNNSGGVGVSFPICNGACWNKPGGWRDGEVLNIKDIDKWHMWTGTFDSKTGEWRILVDGKEESKLKLDKKPIAAEGEKQLWIGRDQCCDPRYGQDVFDEVAVFNIALTAGQQQGIMSTGLGAAITAVEAIEKLATTWSNLKTQ
jgi:hypothetical protein